MWPWRVKIPTQFLLRLLLLMRRKLLTTVWCRFGSWSFVIKLNFCSDARGLVKILQLKFGEIWSRSLVSILLLIFGHEVEYLVEIGQELLSSRNADVRLNFLRGCMVKILKMEFDQDLCENLGYELNPRVCCAFGYGFLWPFCSKQGWCFFAKLSDISQTTGPQKKLMVSEEFTKDAQTLRTRSIYQIFLLQNMP